jgi:hypothetical protein
MQSGSNVVLMRDFTPAVLSSDSYRVIKECRERSLECLSTSVSSMLDKVEDALWGLAEQATEREDRDVFYKAKDEFRNLKIPMAQHFRLSFMTAFENKSKGLPLVKNEVEDSDEGGLELSLVEDDDLTESLKFGELSNRLRGQCEQELIALDQRMAILLGMPNLEEKDNPLSPALICDAFKSACDDVKSGVKVRMLLLKLFEEHVVPDLKNLYHEVNEMLADHGILPKLRSGARRKAVVGTGPVTGPRTPGAPGTTPTMSGSGPAGVGGQSDAPHGEQDFFSMLQGLLSMNVGQAAFGGVPSGSGSSSADGTSSHAGTGTPISGAELIGSLTRMQRGDTSYGGTAAFNAGLLASGANNILHELKNTSLGGGFGQVDNMTLDIVAMLFDQIFDDRNIPSALKALIGRLQIPVLKVAVLDKKFFSKKHHPARHLLDTLGDFGLGLGEDFNASAPLYQRLDKIVQKLLDDFDDNVEIFEKVIEELNGVIAEEGKRAEEEASKSAKRIADTERLAIARVFAENEIKQRAEEKRLPQVIQDFLATHWRKLLLLTYARGGKESVAWKSAIETMDILIWTVESKQNADERRRLASVLPGLLKRLDAGMKIAATPEHDRDAFFGRLMRCHTKVIEGSLAAHKSHAEPASDIASAQVAPPSPATAKVAPRTPKAEEPPAKPAPAAPTLPHPVDSAIEEKLNQWNEDPLPAPLMEVEHGDQELESVELSGVPAHHGDERASDADIELATAPPVFDKVIIRNPFGAGEIEVEEVDFDTSLPLSSSAPDMAEELKPLPPVASVLSSHGDASGLKEGSWVEIRRADDSLVQARLAYISPMRNTYLFTNRQGTKVAEFTLYELAREIRSGNITVIEEVPLFDRAMGSIVGTLRKNAPAH